MSSTAVATVRGDLHFGMGLTFMKNLQTTIVDSGKSNVTIACVPLRLLVEWILYLTGQFSIMGATGSGKTTVRYHPFQSASFETMRFANHVQFINLASGSQLGVGRGLQSCTNSVQEAQTFELDGRYVTLIDTPGFDDTTKSDRDILHMIADFLAVE